MEFANQIGLEMVDILLGISPISQCVCLRVGFRECVRTCANAVGFLLSAAININVGSKLSSSKQTRDSASSVKFSV